MYPEPDMLTEAVRLAAAGAVGNVSWVRGGSTGGRTGLPQRERALPWHVSFVLVSAYLIAIVPPTGNAEELAEYRRCVGATLEPYGGRYLARSEPVTVLEGDWDGAQVVVVEFPNAAAARAWNDSKAYQEIAPLRLRNTLSVRVIVEGPGRS